MSVRLVVGVSSLALNTPVMLEVTFEVSQVNGLVHVENNAAPAPVQITVAGNTVTGSLYCTGNDPAPADNGQVNTVSGTATDQCAAISVR